MCVGEQPLPEGVQGGGKHWTDLSITQWASERQLSRPGLPTSRGLQPRGPGSSFHASLGLASLPPAPPPGRSELSEEAGGMKPHFKRFLLLLEQDPKTRLADFSTALPLAEHTSRATKHAVWNEPVNHRARPTCWGEN